jgi:zinc transporter ZupT
MLFFVGALAFVSTMLGGLFALRLKEKLHLILGFSAGAVVGLAFFELIPEALELGAGMGESKIMTLVAVGFLLYLLLDRMILLGHSHGHEADNEHLHVAVEGRGHVRAASLSVHSFLDGVGVGLAFQVSPVVGFAVTAAVLAHDFSDGINTVNVVMRHGGSFKKALQWLLIDAVAPIAGIIFTLFFAIPGDQLGALLAVFAGFFLYIGAADLIPESHHQHPKFLTTATTLLGAFILYVAIQIAG